MPRAADGSTLLTPAYSVLPGVQTACLKLGLAKHRHEETICCQHNFVGLQLESWRVEIVISDASSDQLIQGLVVMYSRRRPPLMTHRERSRSLTYLQADGLWY